MDDTISRQAAISTATTMYERCDTGDIIDYRDMMVESLEVLPSAQPDNRLAEIADLVEGTIDHFDLEDAMDLLYQIKDVLKNG